MNAIKNTLLSLVATAALLTTQPLDSAALASGWTWQDRGNGYFLRVDASGANDGWWYTRARVCTKGCYGHCNCSYNYRQYSKISSSYSRSSGWREQILKIAASSKEHQEYMEALRALGVNAGSYSAGGYSVSGTGTAGYGYPLAQQGNTVYGYSAFTSNFGNVDVSGILNQSYRLASQAQELSGQATSDYTTMTSQTVAAQERIAATLAQGQAAAQALSSVKAEATKPEFHTFSFRATATADGLKVEPIGRDGQGGQAGQGDFRALAAGSGGSGNWTVAAPVLIQYCGACHGGKDRTAGGLDLKNMPNWNAEQQVNWFTKIKERVRHPLESKRMPLAANDEPGEPLPLDALELILCNLPTPKQ